MGMEAEQVVTERQQERSTAEGYCIQILIIDGDFQRGESHKS